MTVDPFASTGAPDFEEAGEGEILETESQRKMPHPETGQMKWFTRSSKFANTGADEHILTEWKIAFAVMGVTKNDGLYALANSHPLPEEPMALRPKGWWKPWAEIGHKGMDFADAKSGAHQGTAIHSWTGQVDAGQITIEDVPKRWRPHVEAYLRIHAANRMKIHTEYAERLVLNLSVHNGVCGRLDGLRELPDGSLVVDDTKTGKSVDEFGLGEIAKQLAIYAYSEWMWAGPGLGAFGWVPMPANVRRDIATVTWVPINRPEESRVIPIDIEEGWDAVQRAAKDREYNNRAKRKSNGLELPLSVLSQMEPRPDPLRDDHNAIALSISQATSLGELGNIYTDAFTVGAWNPILQELGDARKREILGIPTRR